MLLASLEASVPMERFVNRRERLREALRSDDVDALLISSSTNVSYLTGFSGESSVLVLGRESDRIISDGRFTTQIEQECPGLEANIRLPGQEMVPTIARMVASLGMRRLAFEAGALTVADHLSLHGALTGVSLVGVEGRVEALRQIKDEDEIAANRASHSLRRASLHHAAGGTARWGQRERRCRCPGGIHAALRRNFGSSFPPIMAVGARSALPHARPTTTTRIGDDDFVLVDWGATGRPYKSDLTRVLVTGKVTSTFESIYRTVLLARKLVSPQSGRALRPATGGRRSPLRH